LSQPTPEAVVPEAGAVDFDTAAEFGGRAV
jgi:hypothetical protein